jgi:hypothetical protein
MCPQAVVVGGHQLCQLSIKVQAGGVLGKQLGKRTAHLCLCAVRGRRDKVGMRVSMRAL